MTFLVENRRLQAEWKSFDSWWWLSCHSSVFWPLLIDVVLSCQYWKVRRWRYDHHNRRSLLKIALDNGHPTFDSTSKKQPQDWIICFFGQYHIFLCWHLLLVTVSPPLLQLSICNSCGHAFSTPLLLAPQSGALRISAYRDFQSNPNPIQSTYSFL